MLKCVPTMAQFFYNPTNQDYDISFAFHCFIEEECTITKFISYGKQLCLISPWFITMILQDLGFDVLDVISITYDHVSLIHTHTHTHTQSHVRF